MKWFSLRGSGAICAERNGHFDRNFGNYPHKSGFLKAPYMASHQKMMWELGLTYQDEDVEQVVLESVPPLYMIWLWIRPGLPTLTRAWTPSQRRCDPTSSSSHRPRSPRPWWSRPLSLSETASLQLSRPFVILLPLVLILLLLTLWRSTLTHSPKISTFTQNTIYPDYPPPSPTGLHSLSDDWHTLTHKIRSSFLFPFLGNNKWSGDIDGQTNTYTIYDRGIGDSFSFYNLSRTQA